MTTKATSGKPLRIALVGTRGVPASYGGFETCVEEVGGRLADRGHQVTVYCRTAGSGLPQQNEYLGMKLVHLPALHRRSLETLSHTGLSVAHMLQHRPDAAIVFNAANAPWLPLIRLARIPIATHVDGLEWKRAKWGTLGRRYYRIAESAAVVFSDALISDATGIQDYYRQEFGANSELISYGAPIVSIQESTRIFELGLKPGGYHLVVARFEPENHVDLIVDGYRRSDAKLPLVVVGSAPYSEKYTHRVHTLSDERVHFVGGIWDQELLNQLYANALVYWHGHSVGGTNPSLLRAMGAGAATNAFDVNFNREVLGDAGRYFAGAAQVRDLVSAAESDDTGTRSRGKEAQDLALRYDWEDVADRYETLSYKLFDRSLRRSGRPRRFRGRHVTSQSGGSAVCSDTTSETGAVSTS